MSLPPFSEYMIVWVVRKNRTSCVFEQLSEALEDWKTHPGELRLLYPKPMSIGYFSGLNDFEGW